MIFLSDKGREYTYGDLLSAVNTACSYKPLYRASGLYPYFVNFLTALVAGAPVVLLDSDLSPSELDGVDERAVNSETDLPQHVAFDNIGGLIEAVFSSQSQITIFTSGTTGQPKEVVHTVQSLSRSEDGATNTETLFGLLHTILRIWPACKYSFRHSAMAILL